MNYLSKEQVFALNEKHGWFQSGDAQSDVSRAFAQDAIAMHERMRDAAPDLLAALQALLSAVGNITTEYPTGYDGDRAEALADAAIKKATGETA